MDKQLPQDYYPLIMASERVQRRIDHLLDQTEEAVDQLDWERVHQLAEAVLDLDPDGYPWEVAWNPGFKLKEDGSVVLPE